MVTLFKSVKTFRLAQGHARFMQHQTIAVMDAVTAVMLLEMTSMSILDGEGQSFGASSLIPDIRCLLHTTFPADPKAEYCKAAERILLGLRLDDLWEKELERLKVDDVHGQIQTTKNEEANHTRESKKSRNNSQQEARSSSQNDDDLMTQESTFKPTHISTQNNQSSEEISLLEF